MPIRIYLNFPAPTIFMYVLLCFRLTEDSHVKTNTVHTLFRVRKYGQMDLEKLKDVLSAADFMRCKRGQKKTWYTMPMNISSPSSFR
jgi:hypothetical protein